MEKNNKIIVISIITILSLLLLILLLLNNNKSKTNNKSKIVKEENIFISIVTKSDQKIYGITDNNKEIELLDISEYNGGVVYTYINSKLYLYLQKYQENKPYSNNSILGYIDLNSSNYNLTTLTHVEDEGYPNSIAILDNTIYYTSSASKIIYNYNIDTKEKSTLTINNLNNNYSINLYSIENNTLIYSNPGSTNEKPKIGIIDINLSTNQELVTNSIIEYIYNNKIIYKKYNSEKNFSQWKYYEYDVANSQTRQISDITTSNQGIYNSLIVPVEDYYIYVNENALYKYIDNQDEKIIELDGSIDNIILMGDKTLNIEYIDDLNQQYKYLNLNLDNLTTKETTENNYSKVLYIK